MNSFLKAYIHLPLTGFNVTGSKITYKCANNNLRIGFLYDRQVFKNIELGNSIHSAYLKILNLILPQKVVSGFCADTAKHFAHLPHIDHIRVFPKKKRICPHLLSARYQLLSAQKYHAGNTFQLCLFLVEINSMPISLQTKLLRVLQEKSVRRIGAKNEIPIRYRIISSSNEDPWECVKKYPATDLYYRLSVICINIPPLRERNGDVIPLANYFMQKYAPIYGNTKIKISAESQEALNTYSWSGNVRELEHTLESSIVMLEDGENLSIQHLPPHLNPSFFENTYKNSAFIGSAGTLKEILLNFEKEVILNTLQNHNWNISRSAKAIDVRRSSLQYRMRKLEINNPLA